MQPFSFQIEDDMTRQAQFQLSFQKFYVKHDDDDDGEEEDADDEGARGKFRKSIIVFISESLSLISLVWYWCFLIITLTPTDRVIWFPLTRINKQPSNWSTSQRSFLICHKQIVNKTLRSNVDEHWTLNSQVRHISLFRLVQLGTIWLFGDWSVP